MSTMDNAHALVVGIADYKNINRLPDMVIQDASAVAALLVDPKTCGYPKDNVELVLDDEATKAGLQKALADLAARAEADSTVFIYVSSHGGRVTSGPHAGEYLLPVDVDYTSGQSIADTAISGVEFTIALRAVKARKVVVVFDCCHAAGIGQPKAPDAPTLEKGLSQSYYDALAAGRGRVILASSRSTESSWVMPDADNSLFTTHLLAGLRGGVVPEDGLIRIFNLFEYVQPRVTADKPVQHPIFKADELEENFAIALYLGGEKGVVPKPSGDDGFLYDAYISYVDQEPDSTWVWDKLVPRLKEAGVRVVVSGDAEPGAARVVSVERGIRQSKRTVIVLSPTYLDDRMAGFENVLAQTMGIQEGTYRLLPVKIAHIEDGKIPVRISQLVTLDLVHPRRADRELDRLIKALKGPPLR